jgi:hypothetical protein
MLVRWAKARVCHFVIQLIDQVHQRINFSAGQPVDPFEGGKIIVPVCAIGKAYMRVGSYAGRGIK